MSSVPTTLLDRYTLEETIARGGMGTVWKATDEVLARTVAVKVLHPHLSEDEAFVERFRREALAAARLVHPNIVAIYDSGSHEVTGEQLQHFIVMEYCSGGTVAGLLAGRGRLAPDRVVAIGIEICDALDYAHRNGVIHRDVKPANVLLTHDSIKVADFGIAKAAFATGDITTTGSILGTVTYISPEQAQGKEPDARSDLYALGIVLYELLVGRPPFQEATQMATVMRHVHDPPPAPRSLKAGIPRALDAVLLKSLAKDPDARFASAAEMRNALISAAAPATVSLRTTGAPARTPPLQAEPHTSSGDARWIIGVLAIVAAAVVLALAIPALLGESEDGTSVRPGNGDGAAGGQAIQVDEVADFDPYGSSGEHPEDTHLAADGDPATAWGTQTYDDSFEVLNKPGVGLVFDLGSPQEISAVELQASDAGYDVEILADDEHAPDDLETDFEQIAVKEDLSADDEITFDPAEYRYWLVWITSLPGGGAGSMELSEVTFLAP